MENTEDRSEMPDDIEEYIVKGFTDYRWSFDYMVKDLLRFGIEEEEAMSIVSKVVEENHLGHYILTENSDGNDASSTSEDLSNGTLIAFGVAIFAVLVFALAKTSFAGLAMFLIIMLLVGSAILYYFLTMPTDKRIIRKLNKMGYKCHLYEGVIAFTRRDANWRIETWNIKKRFRRVSFNIGFSDDNLDKDHALTNRIFCIIASRNRHVTLAWNGANSYVCSFYTVFTSTKDIEREFNTAMAIIDDTLNELYTLFQQAFEQQPAESKHKIGFNVGDSKYSSEDLSSETRAQKDTETTN